MERERDDAGCSPGTPLKGTPDDAALRERNALGLLRLVSEHWDAVAASEMTPSDIEALWVADHYVCELHSAAGLRS